MSNSGISAMIRCAIQLEGLGAEILEFGRAAFDRIDSCTLVMAGRFLCHHIKLDGGFVTVSAQLMDEGSEPELLLKAVGDTEAAWQTTIIPLVASLERNEVRSLERPIDTGGDGPNHWVIT